MVKLKLNLAVVLTVLGCKQVNGKCDFPGIRTAPVSDDASAREKNF
jgi:hypothetical protein